MLMEQIKQFGVRCEMLEAELSDSNRPAQIFLGQMKRNGLPAKSYTRKADLSAMARTITLADGRIVEVECLSCALTSGLIQPTGGVIVETDRFHAHQDVAYPIRGLVILASKRHFYGMDELRPDEQGEFIRLVHAIRQKQRELLGIEHVYYFYNEDTTHHFHLWMVPRYDWMNEIGRSVESLRPVLLHARNNRNTEENRREVLEGIEILREGLIRFRP